MSEFLVWRDFNESQVAELEGVPVPQRRAFLSKYLAVPKDFLSEPRRSLFIDFCVRNVAFAVNCGMHGAKVSTLTSLLGDTLQWACGLVKGSMPQNGAPPNSTARTSTTPTSNTSGLNDQQAPDLESSHSQTTCTSATESPDSDTPKEGTSGEATEEESTGSEKPTADKASTETGAATPDENAAESAEQADAVDATASEDGDKPCPTTVSTLSAATDTLTQQSDVLLDTTSSSEQLRVLLPTLASTLQYFDSLLLKHAVERPPFSVGVYSLADVKAITDHTVNTLFNNFELYRVAFVPDKCVSVQPIDEETTSSNEQDSNQNTNDEAGQETQAETEAPRSEEETANADERSEVDDKPTPLAEEVEKLRREFAISMEQQREVLEKKLAGLEEKFK